MKFKKLKRSLLIPVCILTIFAFSIFIDNDEPSERMNLLIDAEAEEILTVTLDAGHGGYDTGAIAVNGEYEKDITLDITLRIGAILEANGINVEYTRTSDDVSFAYEDNKTDLHYRAKYAESVNSDLFISLHCNASDYGYYYGFETWTDIENDDALALAELIQESMDSLNFSNDRGVVDGSDSLYLIGATTIPSCLIEIGFIDNDTDYSYIITETGKTDIANAIANSILTYLDNSNEQNTPL